MKNLLGIKTIKNPVRLSIQDYEDIFRVTKDQEYDDLYETLILSKATEEDIVQNYGLADDIAKGCFSNLAVIRFFSTRDNYTEECLVMYFLRGFYNELCAREYKKIKSFFKGLI